MANARDIKYLENRANRLLWEADKVEKMLEKAKDVGDSERVSKYHNRLKLINAQYDIMWDIVAGLDLESRYNADMNGYTISKRKS